MGAAAGALAGALAGAFAVSGNAGTFRGMVFAMRLAGGGEGSRPDEEEADASGAAVAVQVPHDSSASSSEESGQLLEVPGRAAPGSGVAGARATSTA